MFFASDNGGLSTAEGSPTSNLPLRGGKGWVYEGGIREPWIIRLPGAAHPGSSSAVPIMSTDIFPTALAAAGVTVPQGLQIDGTKTVPSPSTTSATISENTAISLRLKPSG